MGTVTRRGLLGGLASTSLLACGDDGDPLPVDGCQDVAPRLLVDPGIGCEEDRFEELVQNLVGATYAESFDLVATELRGGLDLATLLAANFQVALRVVTPSAGAVMHSLLSVSSANMIGARLEPHMQLAAVLWSTGNVKGEQGGAQTPLPPVDEAALPASVSAARQLLIDGLDDFDPEAADAGAAAMLRLAGPDELVELLLRSSAREGDAHRQIFPGQCFRALDTFGWGCAERVIRCLARVLAEGPGPTASTFTSSLELSKTVDVSGASYDLPRVLEWLAIGREVGAEELRDATASLLNDGLAPGALWDGLLAVGAEVILRGNGGGGLHYFDAINALRSGAARANSAELTALFLLQAAAFVPAQRVDGQDYYPFQEVNIDQLAAGTAPDDLEELFERGGRGRGKVYDPSPASDAVAWFALGGSVCEYLARGRELVVQKGQVDAHFYKFPAAVFEEIERVHPYWVPLLLGTELLVNPAPTSHDDWPGLEEALGLAAELGL